MRIHVLTMPVDKKTVYIPCSKVGKTLIANTAFMLTYKLNCIEKKAKTVSLKIYHHVASTVFLKFTIT